MTELEIKDRVKEVILAVNFKGFMIEHNRITVGGLNSTLKRRKIYF